MSHEYRVFDAHQICRACLKTTNDEAKCVNLHLLEIYEKITQIKINAEMNLPCNICKHCRNEITIYDAFREKCVNNEKILLQYIQNQECGNILGTRSGSENVELIENDLQQHHDSNEQILRSEEPYKGDVSLLYLTMQCSYCNKSIKNKSLLRHHVKKYHKDIKDNSGGDCKIKHSLDDTLTTSLKEEAVIPKGERGAHVCIVCKMKFCSFPKLLLHMETHSTDGLIQCEKCPKQFEDYKTLTRHLKNHTGKPFLCYNCGKTFKRSSDYSVHMRMHTGEKPYECKTCHKKFKTSYMCIIHSRLHTGEKPSQCKICCKKFISNSHLSVHMRSHNKSRPFPCKDCGRAFAQEKDLEIHSTLHSGQTLFQCDTCGRGFNRKNNLSKHMKLHEGIKTHVCQTCSFAFPTSTQLKTHLRTHTGDRPYSCDKCPAKFASSSGVSRHKKTHKKQSDEPKSKPSTFVQPILDNNLIADNTTQEIIDANVAIIDFTDDASKPNYDSKNNIYAQDITYTLFNNI